MTRFESIQANVPKGTILPDDLRRLCDLLDQTGYPISGCMKIRPDDFGGVRAWFGDDEEMASNFAYFGAGPDGSILALWLINGNDATSAPVVHLGSEGDKTAVLAEDFRSFLHLLGIGYDELGFDDLQKPPEDPDSASSLRAWLKREYSIICPAVGAEIVKEAQLKCPDLQTEIDDWSRGRYGG